MRSHMYYVLSRLWHRHGQSSENIHNCVLAAAPMSTPSFGTSCFIRLATMRRWRYGVLSVGESAVTWRPYWSLRRPVTVLGRGHVSVLGVHEALGDYGGRNI